MSKCHANPYYEMLSGIRQNEVAVFVLTEEGVCSLFFKWEKNQVWVF